MVDRWSFSEASVHLAFDLYILTNMIFTTYNEKRAPVLSYMQIAPFVLNLPG